MNFNAAHLIFVALIATHCHAQSTQSPPEFEVASVKPAIPGPHQGVWSNGPPDEVRMLNMNLGDLISFAYHLKSYQISVTGWMESVNYDVVAKVPSDAAKLPWEEKFALMRLMTRTMLAERFKLALHKETKELPAYALVVGKNGSLIRELGPNPGENVVVDWRRGHLSAKMMPMSQLVELLSNLIQRPVLDQTGIKGIFDVTLDWEPDSTNPPGSDAKPPLNLALQEQLGLKLEARKAPIDVMVVDHAERASEN